MKKIKYSSAVCLYFSMLLALLAVLPVAFYVYDPLQVFHAPWGREWGVNSNMRLQAAGIINSYKFDSIILGTSMLENTSADVASEVLSGDFVNLSVSGSQHYERSLILEYALRKKDLKKVIYSLDSSYLSPAKENPSYPLSSYDFLYDGNVLNDVGVYYNDHFFGCLIIWAVTPACTGREVSMDRPSAWFMVPAHARRFGGLDNWFLAKNSSQVRKAFSLVVKSAEKVGRNVSVNSRELDKRFKKSVKYIDETIVRHARENPGVVFYYVFPPYSRIRFSIMHQVAPLEARLHEGVVRYFAERSSELSNIKVYGYEDQDFLDRVDNYKDPGHYKEEINTAMLHGMSDGLHLIRADNVDRYLEKAREKAFAFDLVGLAGRIENYLNAPKK